MIDERLKLAIEGVIERFESEYQILTDGQFGSVENFSEVAQLRALIAELSDA